MIVDDGGDERMEKSRSRDDIFPTDGLLQIAEDAPTAQVESKPFAGIYHSIEIPVSAFRACDHGMRIRLY